MMRWLKDKKREKRSSSVGYDEEDNDDDYGFEKEKASQACSKSPTTKRQLPPTPLTPEEISPHIYEEIHDGQIICASSLLSGSARGSRYRVKRVPQSPSAPVGAVAGCASVSSGSYIASSSASSKYTGKGNDITMSSTSTKDDSISPYMVVPVDEEVRQTPTNFHRNGTPEVHCDVIVKETHCEILLSRKPKVSAFKPDPSSVGKENISNNYNISTSSSSGNPAIRNNTHFCSRNRRASVDVHNLGGKSNGSSSGAWNSSAFSSSSTSRVNSMGTSMMSLSTLSERDRLPTLDDNASSGSSAKGILTYTVGGNVIPRGTKLTFNPLKPMDGDDTSLSNQDPFFSMMPPPPSSDSSVFGDSASIPIPNSTNPSARPSARLSSTDDNSSPTVYSQMSPPSTKTNTNSVSNSNNNNFPYQPPSTQVLMNPELLTPKSSNDFIRDSSAALSCNKNSNPNPTSIHGYNPNIQEKPAHSIGRASSPSNASSCTYASVSFPTEPKIYNTIAPDLISQETTRELQSHTVLRHLESSVEGESETESVRYSSIRDTTPFGNISLSNPGHHAHKPAPNNTMMNGNSSQPFQFGVGIGADDSVYSGVSAYRIDNDNSNTLHSTQASGFCSGKLQQLKPQAYSRSDQARLPVANSANTTHHPLPINELHQYTSSRADESSSSIIYSGIINQNEAINNNDNDNDNSSTLYACIEPNPGMDNVVDVDQTNLMQNLNIISTVASNNNTMDIVQSSMNNTNNSLDTSEADVDRLYGEAAGISVASSAGVVSASAAAAVTNSILLDFCTCSDDQHSSGCGGFLDGKADDDTSSIATTINEHRGPCTGCGRLIRQITYSESYSDDTYEHVYSSRLLLRRGRRFSSPDITMSEISNSETNREFDDVKSQCHLGTQSRDDTWMTTSRHDDVRLTFYRPAETEIETNVETEDLLLNSPHLSNDAHRLKEEAIGTEPRYSVQSPPIPPAKPRQSFSAFGSSVKTSNILQDKATTNVHSLAHHRSSLPVIHPSNLVPVTDVMNHSSTTNASQLQPKSSPFSNLLSKLSRPKPPKLHANKTNDAGTNVKSNQKQDDFSPDTNLTNANIPSHEMPPEAPIPDKNTTKLSKFFQLLSNNDNNEGKEEAKATKEKKRDDDFKTKGLKVDIPENSITKTSKLLRSPSEPKAGNHFSAFKGNVKLSPNNNNNSNNNSKSESGCCPCPNNQLIITDDQSADSILDVSIDNTVTRPTIGGGIPSHANNNEALVDSIIIMNENKVAAAAAAISCNIDQGQIENVMNPEAKTKPQNKTDSGDTCYEYDISTSSESEQTSYDYVLSKVKKSLNLEHEVQQIADMNALRRKMFCKKCKKSDMCGGSFGIDNDDSESIGSDNGCPHFSAKFGDLRKIFGDFVVDQRAAILDCLTDYAHGPFNVKGEGRDNMCRGCGGEIMTSDSESMTTVYSILSQQFRRTSPGTHTPSCDSDEGTMADNSCESADEEDNDVSSGYDEAIGPICEQHQQHQHYTTHKTKRKEKSRDRKERRLHHVSSNSHSSSCKDQEKHMKKRNSNVHAQLFSKTDGQSGENNPNAKPYQGDGNIDNNGIVNENKYQIRHKQDTVHSTVKSFHSTTHSSSSSSVQKNSSKKGGGGGGGSNGNTDGHNVACDNTNTTTTTNNNNLFKNSNSNNSTTNNNHSNHGKPVCNQLHKHGETGSGTGTNTHGNNSNANSKNNNNNNNNNSPDNNRNSNSTRPKPRLGLATEKVIQDIYAPLPSKALSWLTARSSSNSNNHTNTITNTHESNIYTAVSSCSCNTSSHSPHQQYFSTKNLNSIQKVVEVPVPSENSKLSGVLCTCASTCNGLTPNEKPSVFTGVRENCMVPGTGQTTSSSVITSSCNSNIINNNINITTGLDSSVQTHFVAPQPEDENNSSAVVVAVKKGGSGSGSGSSASSGATTTMNDNMKEDSRHKRSGGSHFNGGSEKLSELKDEDRLEFNAEVGARCPIESRGLKENGSVCYADCSHTCSSSLDNNTAAAALVYREDEKKPTESTNSVPVFRQSKEADTSVCGNQGKNYRDVLTSRQMQKKLQMAALDLLPETVLGSDADEIMMTVNECNTKPEVTITKSQKSAQEEEEGEQHQQQQQNKQQQRMKSKMVERLAKMFEDNSNSNSFSNNNNNNNNNNNMTTSKSENINNNKKKSPSKTEATTTTPTTTDVNMMTTTTTTTTTTSTTHVGNGDGATAADKDTTHGVVKFTGVTTANNTTTTTTTTTNTSNGRSYIRAPTAPTSTSHQIATAALNTADIDNTNTAATTTTTTTTTPQSPPTHTTGSSAVAAIVQHTPFQKQQQPPTQKLVPFSHPSPSPSFVKTPRFTAPSNAPSPSTTATTTTTNIDHSDKSPLYHYRSSSSSSLLLSSAPTHINNNNNNCSGKNSDFNTSTNTPSVETNSNRNLIPTKPPTPKKPSLFTKAPAATTPSAKSKYERSRREKLKVENKTNSALCSERGNPALTSSSTSETSKDIQAYITNTNNEQRRKLKNQKSEINSRQASSSSSSARKQLVSPSPSTSSGSSSKRNRVGTGSSSNGGNGNATRQKKLSKRGHPHRRARSKSERRHKSSHHHHEERTRYYFSSDLSDIDVIEVEDWETYSSARAHPGSGTATPSGRESSSGKSDKIESRRRRGDKHGAHSRSAAGESSFTEDSGDHSMIQEIYSIPPSSAEIRGAAGGGVPPAAEGGNTSSPQMSPDVTAKLSKKSKTTDTIYKSKKNNNKLLSDLIIRNYDRQMYDVSGNNGNNSNTSINSNV